MNVNRNKITYTVISTIGRDPGLSEYKISPYGRDDNW